MMRAIGLLRYIWKMRGEGEDSFGDVISGGMVYSGWNRDSLA
jgi:hypothetical protein